jgi:recombination directionality factor gp3-like protein
MGSRIMVRQDDGILAAQRRLRELGRIRTGWSEPYTKDGRDYRRPVRSKTIVLTTAERGLLDEAAEYWGGTVERWQPQGNNPEVWRLVTDRDAIEAILPPGDPLNQTLEMWSGGGCVRRCDGITEKITDKPCLCFAQFGADFHEVKPKGGVPQVCKPTSRLSVFLELGGLGLWRVETHSYYAMLEMAGTIDLIKARVGPEPSIPIRLRIDPRVRLAQGKPTGYPVLVIELQGRGVVAQILTGSVDGLALEAPTARQAIEAAPRRDAEETPAEPVEAEPWDTEMAAGGEPEPPDEMGQHRARIAAADTEQDLRVVWRYISEHNTLSKEQAAEITQVFWDRLAAIRGRQSARQVDAAEVKADPPAEPAAQAALIEPAEPAEPEPNKMVLWMEAVTLAGHLGWSTEQLATKMEATVGRTPLSGDGWHMQQFVEAIKTGAAS